MKKSFCRGCLAALLSVAVLAGCGSAEAPAAQEACDQAILVVSFGTSYHDSREETIGAVEQAIQKAFPAYEVRRAFTSERIIEILKERDGLQIDTVEEALERAAADGIKTLVVQPTHLMNGLEYTDLAKTLTEHTEAFEQVVLADPLLTDEEDFMAVADAITADTEAYADGKTAICFMGHGTEAESNQVYPSLQEVLRAKGFSDYYIGTVEAEPGLEEVLAAVKEGTYDRVVLQPLMLVAGDHANNDMAGEEADSWKSVFTAVGYTVESRLRGLGQIEEIQSLYVAHTQAAIDRIQ